MRGLSRFAKFGALIAAVGIAAAGPVLKAVPGEGLPSALARVLGDRTKPNRRITGGYIGGSRYRGWRGCGAKAFRRRAGTRADYRSQFDAPRGLLAT